MLFNSIEFIFAFLPATAVVFFALGRRSQLAALLWLGAASLAFYGWWDPRYIVLLLASVIFNFALGKLIALRPGQVSILAAGLSANLLLLGYFKYANFFGENIGLAAGVDFALTQIILPLGISFFTFTQIAYLVDAYKREVREYSFLKYLLFATYFPHLIAGPILHHREMMPQFDRAETFLPDWEKIAQGCTFFSVGLVKKVLLADVVAPYATSVFDAARTDPISFFEAWQGALAYTFQLYFDFSGYCDMALGAALIFGIRLPINFSSPYKARSIIDFWRCWHITLSRFLRDYLYIPLGGNRHGPWRRHVNLMIVMLLGGLWHGAGWTFVGWGALHGVYLLINHAWRAGRLSRSSESAAGAAASWTLTFLSVVVAWVFFRAENMSTALGMIQGMAGLSGFQLDMNHRLYLGSLASVAEWLGVTFRDGTLLRLAALPWLAGMLAICLMMPSSQEWILGGKPLLGLAGCWRPSPQWGIGMALLATAAISRLGAASEFLYFNF